jgi:putative membrane protein
LLRRPRDDSFKARFLLWGFGGTQNDLDRQLFGGAGRRVALLFSCAGDVSLDPALGLKTFRNSLQKANDSAVLAANQGLYNSFLAAGLVWGLVQGNPAFALQIKTFFLLYVIVAGVYGAATVSRRILYVQAAPAAIALILLWLT